MNFYDKVKRYCVDNLVKIDSVNFVNFVNFVGLNNGKLYENAFNYYLQFPKYKIVACICISKFKYSKVKPFINFIVKLNSLRPSDSKFLDVNFGSLGYKSFDYYFDFEFPGWFFDDVEPFGMFEFFKIRFLKCMFEKIHVIKRLYKEPNLLRYL